MFVIESSKNPKTLEIITYDEYEKINKKEKVEKKILN